MSERRILTVLPSRARLMLRAFRSGGRPGAELGKVPKVRLEGLKVDAAHLGAYARLCGFEDDGQVPLPYLFVLAFDAQLALMTDPSFPLKALGMVHLDNVFEWLGEPMRADETFDLEVQALSLETVEKGRRVKTEAVFTRSGEPVARSVSTSFSRGGGHGRAEPKGERPGPPTAPPATWDLASDIGRRYARVSGDYNPIHLFRPTARLLGFRRPIAHGMYLVARAVAGLGGPARCLEIRFKTPTFLPSSPRFFVGSPEDAEAQEDAVDFELWSEDSARPHVTGRLKRF